MSQFQRPSKVEAYFWIIVQFYNRVENNFQIIVHRVPWRFVLKFIIYQELLILAKNCPDFVWTGLDTVLSRRWWCDQNQCHGRFKESKLKSGILNLNYQPKNLAKHPICILRLEFIFVLLILKKFIWVVMCLNQILKQNWTGLYFGYPSWRIKTCSINVLETVLKETVWYSVEQSQLRTVLNPKHSAHLSFTTVRISIVQITFLISNYFYRETDTWINMFKLK